MLSAKCLPFCLGLNVLTHWGRVTHICVSELTIIVSDNILSPGRHQAIIWTNAGILLIGPYEINFSEILIEILTFSFMKMSLKVSFAKWRPFCLGINVLKDVHNIIATGDTEGCQYDDAAVHVMTYSSVRSQGTDLLCPE